ncbi:DNA polymerase III subunit gamma/tau, partial [Rhizobium sp. KAs_5_22]
IGKSLDIIEMDAASNNGVNEIRELKEKIEQSPINSRFKIYIIDEFHMLSTSAFNALLKTLEEPPLHAIFIFGTTDHQKLPLTVMSRLQRFNLVRLSITLHTNHLNLDRDVMALFG